MATEHWKRVDRLFHEARRLDPEHRHAFLEQQCADDEALLAEVESLLRHHEKPLAFLDQPGFSGGFLVEPEALADEPDVDPLLGRSIGPYRIERRIAAGGMGTVYYAERRDELLVQGVAIKVLHPYVMDADELRRRFLIECRTQANLQHPNIVRLQDAGVTPDGLSYMIMEYVDGLPVDEYCNRNRLNLVDRLALFQTVCAAIHFAHQNLIVHRDLKPGNILITSDGVPKLLDFGVAKLMEPDAGGLPAATAHTPTMKQMITVDYASPEQIRGEPVTTATDIYSLGVILFELLVGGRPYRLTSRRFEDIRQTICDDPTRRPSTAVRSHTRVRAEFKDANGNGENAWRDIARQRGTSIERLERDLRGDLDNIVLMAMRKEPDRRYASALQFAEDIHRHQHGHPVAARKDTAFYRARKFIQRNRLAVTAASLVIIALLVATIVTSWQAEIAATQRDAASAAQQAAEHEADHARIEAASANQVTAFLTDALRVALHEAPNELEVTAQLLDRHATQVRRQYADEPHLQANLLDAIGRVFMNLHLHDRAVALIDEAATVRKDAFGTQNLEYARSLENMGEAFLVRGDFAQAVDHFKEALRLHETLPKGVHTDVAMACSKLADAYGSLEQLDDAEALHQRALDLRRNNASTASPLVAESLNSLAIIDHARGNHDRALTRLDEALAIRLETLGEHHPLIARTLIDLAVAHLDAGNLDAAEPLLRDAINRYRALADPDTGDIDRARRFLNDLLRQRAVAPVPQRASEPIRPGE